MTKKVLILGATGFIGRNITEQFSKRNHFEVHAVRFHRPAYLCPNVIWHHADLRRPDEIERIIKGMDIIIQAAAAKSDTKETNYSYEEITDNAVMNSYLLRAAYEHKVKHVISFSCTGMYPSADKPLKETDFNTNQSLTFPFFGIGHTKLYIEKMCEFYAGISDFTKFTAIRHATIYGPHDKFDVNDRKLISSMITNVMMAEDKVILPGNGEETYDLLYASDLVNFVELTLSKQPERFRLYHCGYGQETKVKELVAKVISHSRKTLETEYDISQSSPFAGFTLDYSLAQKELNWQPAINLDDGINKTLLWWKENIGIKAIEALHLFHTASSYGETRDYKHEAARRKPEPG